MNDRTNIGQDQNKVVPHGGMSRTSWPKWTGSALLRKPYATIIMVFMQLEEQKWQGKRGLSGVNIELNKLQKELSVGRDEEKKEE